MQHKYNFHTIKRHQRSHTLRLSLASVFITCYYLLHKLQYINVATCRVYSPSSHDSIFLNICSWFIIYSIKKSAYRLLIGHSCIFYIYIIISMSHLTSKGYYQPILINAQQHFGNEASLD